MRKFLASVVRLFSFAAFVGAAAGEPPAWAYPVNPPGAGAVDDTEELIQVADSAVRFTRRQLSTIAGPVSDWHPAEHAPMPAIVGRGRPPEVFACGYCHLPTGVGRPENASLAGLSAGYIKHQMEVFRHGERVGAEPKRAPETTMISLAKAATDAEIAAAAAYFSALTPRGFVRVIETELAPKAAVVGWTFKAIPGDPEPLGARILEMPEDFQRFENRDSRTPYVAYVPTGSIQRGERLIATGGDGHTVQCATCHGPELRGLLDVPRLAGRSPTYLFRQLYDFKQGLRRGGTTELMKPVVAHLTDDDMIALSAALASRAP